MIDEPGILCVRCGEPLPDTLSYAEVRRHFEACGLLEPLSPNKENNTMNDRQTLHDMASMDGAIFREKDARIEALEEKVAALDADRLDARRYRLLMALAIDDADIPGLDDEMVRVQNDRAAFEAVLDKYADIHFADS